MSRDGFQTDERLLATKGKQTVEELKEKIKQADALVLCKSELFLQRIGGETIDTIYPCARELALLLGSIFEKEVSFE